LAELNPQDLASPAWPTIPVTVIEPARRLVRLGLREGWQYRELLYFLTWRDVKIRYKQTLIGVMWAIFQPAIKVLVFSLVFGGLAKVSSQGFPYPIFVFAGLLPWEFFASSVSRGGESVVASANLVRKVYFPRIIIPVAAVGACLVDFAASFAILVVLMLYYGTVPTLSLLMVPPLVMAVLALAVGISLLISALNVAYRDFRYILPVILQVWMFVTPVIYPPTSVPQSWQWLLRMNPMTGIVDGYRSAILGTPFAWGELGISMLVAAAIFVCGLMYFRRMERWFADIV
jgi:lipopolysaccharide transport system permease protein